MRSILCRRLLAGFLVSASAWAAPALAQTGRAVAPAPGALASAGHFAELCQAKLKLAPEQAASLHTYLDQEVSYLTVLAANGLTADTPNLAATESTQLDQVVAKMLDSGQQRDYQKLRQMPQAQAYLRDMALLPAAPDNLVKGKQRKNRTSQMVAQRLDETE